jgi:hypothetical protein
METTRAQRMDLWTCAQLMHSRMRAQLMDLRTRAQLMDTPMQTRADGDDVQEMDRRQHPGG